MSEDKVDNTIYTVGCFTAFENAILDNMKIVIGFGIGVGLILVVGILIAFLEMKYPKAPMGYVNKYCVVSQGGLNNYCSSHNRQL